MPKPAGCKRCKKPRPDLAVAHRDKYCSTKCCRLDHGLALPPGRNRDD